MVTRIYDVFTPGRDTELTYVDRSHKNVALDLETELNRGGKFISLVGPTKMGKTVLVERVAPNAVTIQGQSISSVDDLWSRLASYFGVPTTATGGKVTSDKSKWSFFARFGVSGIGAGSTFGGEHDVADSEGWTTDLFADQILPTLVKTLRDNDTQTTIALDDFHFISPDVRKEVIQALKPLVHKGASVVIITLPHRRSEASRLVRDVGGRTVTLEVEPWLNDDLEKIAVKGFEALNLRDSEGLRSKLSRESYGSPHIMQQLCLELCERANGVKEKVPEPRTLTAPGEWTDFWRLVHDEDSSDWLRKLDAGPKTRGQTRNLHHLRNGQNLDGYGVILTALRSLIPSLSITLTQLNEEMGRLLSPGYTPSKINASTKLAHMSTIAASSLDSSTPELESEDDDIEDPAAGAPQPVFEYVADKEEIHILEPYLAYVLKWHSDSLLGPESSTKAPTYDY